jgi:hypothetical protein
MGCYLYVHLTHPLLRTLLTNSRWFPIGIFSLRICSWHSRPSRRLLGPPKNLRRLLAHHDLHGSRDTTQHNPRTSATYLQRPSLSLPRTQTVIRATQNLFQKAPQRPFLFLFTEAIVQFSTLYNGYLYGLSFLFNSAFVIVFWPEGHEFGTIDKPDCAFWGFV